MPDAPVPRAALSRLEPVDLAGELLPRLESVAAVDVVVDRDAALGGFLALRGDPSSAAAYQRHARLVQLAGVVAGAGAVVGWSAMGWAGLSMPWRGWGVGLGLAGLLLAGPFLGPPRTSDVAMPGVYRWPWASAAVALLVAIAWAGGWLSLTWGVAGGAWAITGASHGARRWLAGRYLCALVLVDPDVRARLVRHGAASVRLHPSN